MMGFCGFFHGKPSRIRREFPEIPCIDNAPSKRVQFVTFEPSLSELLFAWVSEILAYLHFHITCLRDVGFSNSEAPHKLTFRSICICRRKLLWNSFFAAGSGSEKRGLFRKVHLRGSRDSREPPDCGKQSRIRPFS